MRGAREMARHGYAVIRMVLWWNVLAGVLTAQCVSTAVVRDQTISSGCYSTNDTLTAMGAVTVSGTGSVSFIAGRKVDLQPNFRGTAGGTGTTFHAWVETVPSAVSANPISGTGLTQTSTWTVANPYGADKIAEVQAMFNVVVSGSSACYIRYQRANNLLSLRDDMDLNWLGGFAPGTIGTVSNSRCTISGSGRR